MFEQSALIESVDPFDGGRTRLSRCFAMARAGGSLLPERFAKMAATMANHLNLLCQAGKAMNK
jgi:hypothetical protein